MIRIITAVGVMWFLVTAASVWYFTQGKCPKDQEPVVSRLRGRVVGKDLSVYQYKWLRRQFKVSQAKIQIAPYDPDFRSLPPEEAAARARERCLEFGSEGCRRELTADTNGEFDFGPMPDGLYGGTLVAFPGKPGVGFKVRIDARAQHDSMLIDSSPAAYTPCAGWDFEPRKLGE